MKKPTILERLKKIEDVLFKPSEFEYHKSGPNVCTEAAKGPCSYWGPRGGSHHHCRLGLRHVAFGNKCMCRCGNAFDPEPWPQPKVGDTFNPPMTIVAKSYANHAEHWFNKFQETEKTVVRQRLNLVTSQEANESLSQRVDELIHERDRVYQDKVALTDALAYQSIHVKDLKRALEVYGVHYYGCSWHSRGIFSSPKPRVCDCGLNKAVNG